MAKHPLGVLIVHGFTSSLDCVSGVRPPIEEMGLPIRMPVLRGHGAESPEALRGVVWQDWVDDAEAALQDLLTQADAVVVVGLSMGALVTLTLAANHAEESVIDSIVVASSALQLDSPIAPGRPLAFIAPILTTVLKKWDMPPNYADKDLEKYDTNYAWAPTDAIRQLLIFGKRTRPRLPEIAVPALIIHSHKDSTAAPESAEIIHDTISTPAEDKRIVWFEHSHHEIFRDCEREAAIAAVADFVRHRAGL